MAEDPADALKERIESWLSIQLPRIQAHGGTSAIREVDAEAGEVIVELGGACAGCGISHTTEATLQEELTSHFEAVSTVTVTYPGEDDWAVDQPENYMGIDRTQGGRGGQGKSRPASDFF
jgi:Thioredoxin-like proteins and domains